MHRNSSKKMKILMLHGWTQNAQVFRGKTHPFVRKVEKVKSPVGQPTLVWATAPHDLPATLPGDRPNAKSWFYHHETDITHRVDVFAPVRRMYYGWDVSRAYIAELWVKEGPFDVVVGFSQGAVVTHQLLVDIESVLHHSEHYGGREGALRAAGFLPKDVNVDARGPGDDVDAELSPAYRHLLAHPPKAAILVAGFPSRHVHGLPEGALLRTPTLHVSAVNDATVDPAHQVELSKAFESARFHNTEQGHTMPQRAGDMAVVCDFLAGIAAQMPAPS